jgi:hypothetical protein
MFYLTNLKDDQYIEYFTKYPGQDTETAMFSRAYEMFSKSTVAQKYRFDS